MRADSQGYVALVVNNDKVFGATDATYTLTFEYGEKPTSDLTGTVGEETNVTIGKYFALDATENGFPSWLGCKENTAGTSASHFNYAPKVTVAMLTSDFTTNVQPTTCASWFRYCNNTNLTTITGISNLNTSEVTDMSYMFYYCSKLTSLDLTHFNTAKVTDMSHMFEGCAALTSLDLTHFNTAEVTDMSYMFYCCSKLTSLGLSNFNTAEVTDMSYMFYYCIALTSLDLSNFNTAEVTDMSYMFYCCSKLTSLDLTHFNTAEVTDMSNMFASCRALTSLDLSNFNTAKVTDMSKMFHCCSVISSLTFGSNFNTSNVKTMSAMFYQCYQLASLDVTHFNTSNVTDMRNMFFGSKVLTSLDVSNFNTAKVENMAVMFSGCEALTELDLSNFNTSRVTSMNRMFYGCTKLETITVDIQDWTTDAVTKGADMFTNCTKLNTGKANAFDAEKVTYDYARINSSEHFGYLTLKTPVQKFTYYEDKDMTEKVAQLGSNSIGTLTLNRSNMSTTNYGTICLPVSLTAAQVQSTFGEGTVVKKLTGATFDDTSNILYFTFTKESGIEAGKPYLIKSANATPATIANVSISTAEGSSITVKDSKTNADICMMQGVITPFTDANLDKTKLIVSGGELYYSTGGTMKSMRAYFQLLGAAAAENSNSVKARPRAIISDSSETGILSIDADGSLTYEETGDWYTLGGVKLSGKPATKGMYILNGKKYIVK